MELLEKAHIKGYWRTNPKTGQKVEVKEHDDKRPSAQEHFPGLPHTWSQDQVVDALQQHTEGLGNAIASTMQPRKQVAAAPATKKPVAAPQAEQKAVPEPLKVPVPHSVTSALLRIRNGANIKDVVFDYAKMNHVFREQVDLWLASTGHPLADMQGSQVDRFEAVVRHLADQLHMHEKAKKGKPRPQTNMQAPTEKYPFQAAQQHEATQAESLASKLDSQKEGALLTIPDAPKASGLMGTWEKVNIGGDSYWKKGQVFKRSADFGKHTEIVEKQLSAGLKNKNDEAEGKRAKTRGAVLSAAPASSVATGGEEPESGMVEKIPAAQRGETEEVYTDQGDELHVQYAVVEANKPIASHDTALNINSHFPAELQPRDRKNPASENQVNNIIARFQPGLLGANPKASEGAPMVGPDGAVEIGNGRTIALRRIYQSHPELADRYKTWLTKNAKKMGIDPAQVEKLKQPMLVRIRQTAVDRRQFVERTNKPSASTYSAGEQARLDEKILTPEMMGLYNHDDEKGIASTSNLPFVRAFMKTLDPAEVGELMDGAKLGQKGELRMRNAMLQKAYGNTSLVEKMAQATDDTTRNLTSALVDAAPRMASLKAGADAGQLHKLDIGDDIAKAALTLSHLKETRTSVADHLAQQPLDKKDELTPMQKALVTLFDGYNRKPRRLAHILDLYAEHAEALGSPQQQGMFASAPPTPHELLAAAIKRVEKEDADDEQGTTQASAGLFKSAAKSGRIVAPKTRGVAGAESEAASFNVGQEIRKPFILAR